MAKDKSNKGGGNNQIKRVQPTDISQPTIGFNSGNMRSGQHQGHAPDPAYVHEINKIANGLTEIEATVGNNPAGPSIFETHNMNIYRSAQASTFNDNYPQQVIENLEKARKNKHFISMDIESMGVFDPKVPGGSMGFFTPTEISLAHMYRTNKNKAHIVKGSTAGGKYGKHNVLPMVINPEEHASHLQQLINKLSMNRGRSVKLTSDERRTVHDLILYSDAKNFQSKVIDGLKVTLINKQNKGQQLIGDSMLTRRSTIEKMQAGLENLVRYGTPSTNAAMLVAQFIDDVQNLSGQETSIIGHNFRNFDKPAVLQWIESKIGKGSTNSKLPYVLQRIKNVNFVDTLHVEKTLRMNPSVLSRNLTLGELANTKNLDKYAGLFIDPHNPSAHFSPYDIELNGRLFAHQLLDYNRSKARLKKPLHEVMKDSRFARWNDTPVTKGDQFFAISGISGKSAGKYDAVLGLNSQGAYAPEYIMQGGASLYRSDVYSLHNSYKTALGGKEHFAMVLRNHTRGTFHFFARESEEELKNIFHKNLSWLDMSSPHLRSEANRHIQIAKKETEKDAALRRWEKMFSTDSGGGINLINRVANVHEGLKGLDTKGLSQKEYEDLVKYLGGYTHDKKFKSASDSFVRDYSYLRGRFGAELPHIQKAISNIQNSSSLKNIDGSDDTYAQNLALRHYKILSDDVLGSNKSMRHVPRKYRGALDLTIDGQQHILNVSPDLDATRQALSGIVSSGHNRQYMSPGVTRQRLLQLTKQLDARDIITRNQREAIDKMVHGIGNDQSSWYVMEQISYQLEQARLRALDKGKVFGLNEIELEDPTKVHSARLGRIQSLQDKEIVELTHRATERAIPFKNKANGGAYITPGSTLEQVLDHHDMVFERLYKRAGISQGMAAKSVKDTLNDLLKAYIDRNMEVSLYHGVGKRGLMMAVYHPDMHNQVMSMDPRKLHENNNISLWELPVITGNGELGMTHRVARLQAIQGRGGVYAGTGFDLVANKLIQMAGPIGGMVKNKRNPLEIERLVKSITRGEIDNLAMDNSRNIDGYGHPFEVRKSRRANWSRTHTFDGNAYAEQWFTSVHGASHADRVSRIIHQNQGMSFYEAMGAYRGIKHKNGRAVNIQTQFKRGLDDFLGSMGIDANTHSLKNSLVSKNVRSIANVSELVPFGFENNMARENMMKTVNYAPLDEAIVREQLRDKMAPADIDRMLRMGVTTEAAHGVDGNEVNFMSLRAAHMNSKQVMDTFGDQRLSTYEGMFIIRSDVAAGYKALINKEVKLDRGQLHSSIESKFAQAVHSQLGRNFDYSETVMLGDAIPIHIGSEGGLKRDRLGRITVGTLATDRIKTQSDMIYARGWDAENNKFIFEEEDIVRNGSKFIGLNGLRGTATVVDKAEFEKRGMGDIHMIVPEEEIDKRLYGTFKDSAAQLIYDEMHKHATEGTLSLYDESGKLTAGKISLQEGLDTLRDFMNTHLHTENKMRIEGDRILLDSFLNKDGATKTSFRDVDNFVREAEKRFGWVDTNGAGRFSGRNYMVRQIGLARADVPYWEDTIEGSPHLTEGKVRWGLKEMDVIQSRLNRLSHGVTQDGHIRGGIDTSAVSKWLNEYSQATIEAQAPEAHRMANALTRTVLNSDTRHAIHSGEVRPGDVIIRTHAENNEFTVNNQLNEGGKRYGIVDSNNVVHVHANAFNNESTISARGQRTTVGDIHRTMIKMGDSDMDILKEGSLEKRSLRDALAANHGTALLELPQGLDQKYVRFITHSRADQSDEHMLTMDRLESQQNQIWKLTREYNEGVDDASGHLTKIQEAVNAYHGLAAKYVSSAEDGSLSKKLMSSKMDMSGRFRIQSANPFGAEGRYMEEGTAYVSRGKMANMLGFQQKATKTAEHAHEIAQTIFSADEYGAIKHLKGSAFHNKILDKIGEDGLYGFVGRYPTIAESTIQVMKVKIDPRMRHNDQTAMFTVATAERLKADNDGDFMSLVLAQYKTKYRLGQTQNIHDQLGQVHALDQEDLTRFRDETVMPKLNSIMSGTEEIDFKGQKTTAGAIAKQRGITVQDLMRDPQFRDEMIKGAWGSQSGGLADLESRQARLGIDLVGFADNTGQKLLNLSKATYNILETNGRRLADPLNPGLNASQSFIKRTQSIEDFRRGLAQDFISSKKFDMRKIQNELLEKDSSLQGDTLESATRHVVKQREDSLDNFIQGLMRPTDEGLDMMRSANEHLNIFKKDTLEEHIGYIQEMWNLHGQRKNWMYDRNLHLSHSKGTDQEVLQKLYRGEGDAAPTTTFVQNYMSTLDEHHPETAEIKENMRRSTQMFEQHVLDAHERMNVASSTNREMGLGASSHLSDEMLGVTATKSMRDSLSNFTSELAGGSKESRGWGALGIAAGVFGGLWAASTLKAKTPTPQSMQDLGNQMLAPTPPSTMGGPTARIAMNGESVNLHVKGSGGLSNDQVAALIHSQMTNSMPVPVNVNMNVNDNSQNIDKQWLQQVMASAVHGGRAF